MSDNLKKLTSKNKNDYEAVVSHLINDCDVELFAELVEKDDYLFDFIKENVAQRISQVINQGNFQNLLQFLKYYSPFYENVIVQNLVKFSNEDITDIMLEKFETGTVEEKTYAAKYFEYIKDNLAYECLIKHSYNTYEYLAQNCAHTLAVWKDEKSFNSAIEKLQSNDDFEKLSAVKFLVSYGNKNAIDAIILSMKSSAMSENIAGEIPYLISLNELLTDNQTNGLLVLNNIINGLGEILPLSTVFDYELFDVFEMLVNSDITGECATVLLNAADKFDTLTENDEYMFDEDKDTQNEIKDIKHLLKTVNKKELEKFIYNELNESSPFVFTALEFAKDEVAIRELLKSNNQTLILKTAEVLKNLGHFDETARTVALLKVTDINIKSIIRAL